MITHWTHDQHVSVFYNSRKKGLKCLSTQTTLLTLLSTNWTLVNFCCCSETRQPIVATLPLRCDAPRSPVNGATIQLVDSSNKVVKAVIDDLLTKVNTAASCCQGNDHPLVVNLGEDLHCWRFCAVVISRLVTSKVLFFVIAWSCCLDSLGYRNLAAEEAHDAASWVPLQNLAAYLQGAKANVQELIGRDSPCVFGLVLIDEWIVLYEWIFVPDYAKHWTLVMTTVTLMCCWCANIVGSGVLIFRLLLSLFCNNSGHSQELMHAIEQALLDYEVISAFLSIATLLSNWQLASFCFLCWWNWAPCWSSTYVRGKTSGCLFTFVIWSKQILRIRNPPWLRLPAKL